MKDKLLQEISTIMTGSEFNLTTEESIELSKVISKAMNDNLEDALKAIKGFHVKGKSSYTSDSWDAGYHDALFDAEKILVNRLV